MVALFLLVRDRMTTFAYLVAIVLYLVIGDGRDRAGLTRATLTPETRSTGAAVRTAVPGR